MRDPAHPEKIGVFVVIWVSLATAALLGIVAASRSGLHGAAPGGVARGLIAASQADTRRVESA
ncbi:hypothetical protein OOZ51_02215 [Arthrobacter sp. MI7-26]|uniref:hypothetical protein n=1 Tax=Arthrobacter sp. MI7-26 TaxID=2993653 RepID=UPI002249675B|nr:hypothetical protein [Arthrobacter sp. MI7-26]MCX2746628.1 hypothetical protein [Arthrobacter sp. MI7-26]